MAIRALKLLSASAFALAAVAAAQTTVTQGESHQFRVLKDDPKAVADKLISLNGATAHFSGAEGLKVGAGANVVWGLMDRLQLQGDLVWYYLSINNAGGVNYDLEGGAAYTLLEKTRTDDIKVILKFSESTSGNVRTQSATFINSQGTHLTSYKARAGVYSKRSGVKVDDKPGTEETSFTAHGVYAGLEMAKQAALFTEVDGRKGVTSGFTRFYADVMLLPAIGYDEQGSADDPSIFGFRGGMAAYLNPNARNHSEYGRLEFFQVWPTLFAKIEAGMRGGEGWFFHMGGGITLWRNK